MEAEMIKNKINNYSSYKDSAFNWIGSIPSTWRLEKGKWLFKKMERLVRKQDDIITCFRDGQVTLRINRKTEGFTNALKEHGYQGVRKGDLVIHNMDAFAGAIGVSDSDGKSTPVYSVCVKRNPNTVNQYYYAYYLRDLAKSGFIQSLAKGIRERSTDFRFNDFGELMLPVPPLHEQTAIATFLDNKTALIDQAIEIKQKQIELLKERKQILIQKAVTRGLNPNVKMKDSGVEWIGEIPEHWNKTHLKWISKIYAGGTPDKTNLSYWTNGTIPWLASGEVNQEFVTKPTTYISEQGYKNSSAKWIPKGALIIALAGQGKTKGTAAYLEISTTGNQSLAAVIPENKVVSSLFLFYFLKAAYMELRGPTGEGQRDGLNLQVVGDFTITYPKLSEQHEIEKHLIKITSKIKEHSNMLESEIEKLKEYKSTLINSAVTGKIKVC